MKEQYLTFFIRTEEYAVGILRVKEIIEFETVTPDPIFPQEQTNLLIMSKAWCEKHNATEPVIRLWNDVSHLTE